MILKQSVVDVLMFLFERYLGDDDGLENSSVADERDTIQTRLEQMGFQHVEINQAFDWLEDLALVSDSKRLAQIRATSVRIYSEEEKALLNQESINFIGFLQQSGILTTVTRELILDRVIALGQPLDTEQVKWIIMIVLHAYPGEENAFALMESLIFDNTYTYIQ